MRTFRSLAGFGLCFVMLLCLGGAATARESPAAAFGTPVGAPPQSKYLFVEVRVHVSGTGNLPAYIVDFPSYSFDSTTGELRPAFGQVPQLPPLHPHAWGYAGDWYSRSGAAGGGISSRLALIATLPFTTTIAIGTGNTAANYEQTRSADAVLHAIDATGTLSATIDGEDVALAPGQQWQKVVGEDVSGDQYNGHYDVTSTVTNYGWLDRAQIVGMTQWNWLPVVRLPARTQP